MLKKDQDIIEKEGSQPISRLASVEYALDGSPSTKWGAIGGKRGTAMSVIWSGIALMSDGYNAQVLGTVLTILKKLYPNEWNSTVKTRISTAYYVGVIVGSLLFGAFIDRFSRKAGVVTATMLVLLGVALCSAARGSGAEDSSEYIQGFFWMLAVARGVLGVGAGGEYPVSGVNATEAGNETEALRKKRGFLVAMAGCTAIDIGILFGNLIPLIVLAAYGYKPTTSGDEIAHLDKVWRIVLALGAVVPLSVFYFRWQMTTTSIFAKAKERTGADLPLKGWLVVFRLYKWRLFGTCLTWALYDATSYPFGLFSDDIVSSLSGGKDSLIVSTGWSSLILFFYVIGCFVGAYFLDKIGRKNTQAYFFGIQAIVAFIVGGAINPISKMLPLFVILYGVFVALGEAGPGVGTIINAAESFPTPVRGRLFGLSAAFGKAGAAVGTVVFTKIQSDLPGNGAQGVFLVGGAFALLGAFITWFFIPNLDMDLTKQDDELYQALRCAGIAVAEPSTEALTQDKDSLKKGSI
jgi:MFS family permease